MATGTLTDRQVHGPKRMYNAILRAAPGKQEWLEKLQQPGASGGFLGESMEFEELLKQHQHQLEDREGLEVWKCERQVEEDVEQLANLVRKALCWRAATS